MKRKDLKPGTVFRYTNGDFLGHEYYVRMHNGKLHSYHPDMPAQFDRRADSDGRGACPDADVVVLWDPDADAAMAAAATPKVFVKPAFPTDRQERKEMPVARGVIDYFPLALLEVAKVSFKANQQHNPGEPMHWARGKSTDHADCIARHLMERGTVDKEDGLRHAAKLAWRALALLQTELELAQGYDAEAEAKK